MTDGVKTVFDEAAVDEIFQPLDQCRFPGVAVAIAIDGRSVYRKGFGLANIELPVVLSPSIRMRIGSTTKHFVALAYLLLCEMGKAAIDDEIGRHIPELHEENRHATIRQLLGHTSGLRDAFDYSMQLQGTNLRVTEAEMLAFYRAGEGINFKPETDWSYSNGGYMLVAMAVERLSGQTLDDFLRQRVFVPLGMHDTVMRRWDTDFLRNCATLHFKGPDGRWFQHHMGMELAGPGGLVSSMDDMLLWLKHMDAPVVGSPETWRLMQTPHILRNGCSTGYGLGLSIENYRGIGTVSHSGGVISGSSQMIKVPDAKLDISIAANRSDLSTISLANRVIDACVQGLDPLPGELDAPVPVGTFISKASGCVIELKREHDRNMMAINGMDMAACVYPDQAIRLPPAMASSRFEIRPVGSPPEAIKFRTYGNSDLLERVELQTDAALPCRGEFLSQGGSFKVRIECVDGAPRLVTTGPQGSQIFHLEPITRRVLKALSGTSAYRSGILTFSDDGTSFALTAARTRSWEFTRAV